MKFYLYFTGNQKGRHSDSLRFPDEETKAKHIWVTHTPDMW